MQPIIARSYVSLVGRNASVIILYWPMSKTSGENKISILYLNFSLTADRFPELEKHML